LVNQSAAGSHNLDEPLATMEDFEMNGFTVGSKIYGWLATICVAGLLCAVIATYAYTANAGSAHSLYDLPAVATHHQGSGGTGGG